MDGERIAKGEAYSRYRGFWLYRNWHIHSERDSWRGTGCSGTGIFSLLEIDGDRLAVSKLEYTLKLMNIRNNELLLEVLTAPYLTPSCLVYT